MLALAASCGSDNGSGDRPKPQASGPDGGKPSCELDFKDARDLELFPGQSAALALSMSPGSLTLEDPLSLVAVSTADGQAVVEAGYSTGTTELVATLVCSNEQASRATLKAAVVGLQFDRLWSGASAPGPSGREYFGFWQSPTEPDLLYLLGGFTYQPQQFTPTKELWKFSLRTQSWTYLSESPPGGPEGGGFGLAVQPSGEVLFVGGLSTNAGGLYFPSTLARFVPEIEEVRPIPNSESLLVYQPSIAYRASEDTFVTACGMEPPGRGQCDVRQFSLQTLRWEEPNIADGPKPEGRFGDMSIYDEVQDRLIVFGGEANPQSSGCTHCRDDVWALEMATTPWRWVELSPHRNRIDRRNGAMVYDSKRARMLVLGGTQDGATTLRNGQSSLWAFDLRTGKEAWHEVPVRSEPPPRSSAGALNLQESDRIVLGFGNARTVYEDLWSAALASADERGR